MVALGIGCVGFDQTAMEDMFNDEMFVRHRRLDGSVAGERTLKDST